MLGGISERIQFSSTPFFCGKLSEPVIGINASSGNVQPLPQPPALPRATYKYEVTGTAPIGAASDFEISINNSDHIQKIYYASEKWTYTWVGITPRYLYVGARAIGYKYYRSITVKIYKDGVVVAEKSSDPLEHSAAVFGTY